MSDKKETLEYGSEVTVIRLGSKDSVAVGPLEYGKRAIGVRLVAEDGEGRVAEPWLTKEEAKELAELLLKAAEV